MKVFSIVGTIAIIVFFICAGLCIINPTAEIAATGVLAGIISTLSILFYKVKDNNEYWNEVEDLDQQKIFNDDSII